MDDEAGHADDHAHDHDHGDLFAELMEHLDPVFEYCPEGVYVWVDDDNMACNDKLAKLFGTTREEWASEPFLDTYVDPKDQKMFSENYGKAIANLGGPVRFRFRGRRADGKTVELETDMIPFTFAGHAVAYHFVRKV